LKHSYVHGIQFRVGTECQGMRLRSILHVTRQGAGYG
jgi:hypothetical protein